MTSPASWSRSWSTNSSCSWHGHKPDADDRGRLFWPVDVGFFVIVHLFCPKRTSQIAMQKVFGLNEIKLLPRVRV